MIEERNGETVFYQCDWCPCVFLCAADLAAHKHALKITGKEPNLYDHQMSWKILLDKRDHEFLSQEGL